MINCNIITIYDDVVMTVLSLETKCDDDDDKSSIKQRYIDF